jgi:hypothetical protein
VSRGSWVRRHRRVITVVTVIAAVVVLVMGVLSDLNIRTALHDEQSSLRATQGRLSTALNTLSSVETKLAATSSNRDALRVALQLTAWELSTAKADLASTQGDLASADDNLASTQSNLANANTGLYFQGAAISALNACLGGVEQALNQIAVGNQSGALHSISGVAGNCQTAQGEGKGGPVYPFDFPDPDVLRVGTTYYAYATNSATGNVQAIQSDDLAQWTVLGDALPHFASWARPGSTWAPAVFERNGSYVLYYTAARASDGRKCISVAVAGQPQGPFYDNSTSPLVCQLNLGGSIDPSPFVDTDGTPYLTWKSQGSSGPPTIWVQQLSATGTALVGHGPTALLRPSQDWEGGVVEGPDMLVWSRHYYLFYSANNWNSASYAIGVAVCQGPTGPCSKPLDHATLASQGPESGPGGPSLFTDSSGGLWIAFHAWSPAAVGYPNSRLLFIRQVTFVYGIPVVRSSV